ncbi:Gfo/Idh/MocA family protein [Bacillus suaedae]|uniref:Gfo/Idh/MocA family oxidoreductase n=1 Tax=Halalkalibacter suaedae TaxID=2822140 RepID=A0A940WQW6_9BACI|nr:Gfo/Idh/MocA family oxidoreductase [Bacillus suaedae]MBP3951049.1 Gfo/Idh/MocA family oxidoreductase [Bacillus suaedae]
MEELRWGILSTANIAQEQVIPAIQRSKNGVVSAIASSSGRAGEVAEKFNIPTVYESYEDLLDDPNIDVVYIPLPNHLHQEWVIKAAKKGKHILCEKPVAINVEQAEEMVRVCREQNVTFMEAFMYQFHEQHNRVKEIIASGEIGEVKLLKGSFSFYLEGRDSNIRMDPKMGGGSLYDVGCYPLHVIRHILDSEPVTLFAAGEIDPQYGIDISAFGHMKMENGVNATFDCSFDMTNRSDYQVIGTKGVITVPRAYRPDVFEGGEGLIIVEANGQSREEFISTDQYVKQVEHIVESILAKQDPSYPGEKTILNMKVIDACYESMKTGRIVNL